MEETVYNWFKIFNALEFLATGLVSRTYTLNLEGIGQRDVLVTKGVAIGMTYEGVFVYSENLTSKVEFDGIAFYRDPANQDVYLGIEVPVEN